MLNAASFVYCQYVGFAPSWSTVSVEMDLDVLTTMPQWIRVQSWRCQMLPWPVYRTCYRELTMARLLCHRYVSTSCSTHIRGLLCTVSVQFSNGPLRRNRAVHSFTVTVLSWRSSNGSPVYHALSVHFVELSRQHTSWIDTLKQNFRSSEFGTKFQTEITLFLEIPEFVFITV